MLTSPGAATAGARWLFSLSRTHSPSRSLQNRPPLERLKRLNLQLPPDRMERRAGQASQSSRPPGFRLRPRSSSPRGCGSRSLDRVRHRSWHPRRLNSAHATNPLPRSPRLQGSQRRQRIRPPLKRLASSCGSPRERPAPRRQTRSPRRARMRMPLPRRRRLPLRRWLALAGPSARKSRLLVRTPASRATGALFPVFPVAYRAAHRAVLRPPLRRQLRLRLHRRPWR
jgi:hypothetical protein